LLHGIVVALLAFDDLGALLPDCCLPRCRCSGGNKDASLEAEEGSDAGNGPTVVAGRCAYETEWSQWSERVAKVVKSLPGGLAAEAIDERSVDRPGDTEDLEGRQVEPI